jgi:glyoxylase-like metal-dependent hydrolase (beta-lactamase superfamily II)
MQEIIPGVYFIPMLFSNCCLIVDGSKIVLIDAGVRSSLKPILAALESLGCRPENLTEILLTHADIDHVGAADALRKLSGARISASQVEAEALARGRSAREVKAGLLSPLFTWFEQRSGSMLLWVDRVLHAGEVLPVLGGLRVLSSPGHTPGHLSFYAEKHRLLFAGDSVTTRHDSVRANRRRMFNWDQEVMLASLRMQAALQPGIVVCGHGPLVRDAAVKFELD